ncbi:MAG: hypothetical protein GPOALKHO_000449 [Sodalis sp.]|uniref:hypothetical protein n=1 Tax=Sodalis sp. (in: enterobacteria) TaxID=1898979 RepID=UPI003872B9FA|nr:MAG: hypothetical protein GPOALKHO_000449 [Sodalis sp.]
MFNLFCDSGTHTRLVLVGVLGNKRDVSNPERIGVLKIQRGTDLKHRHFPTAS